MEQPAIISRRDAIKKAAVAGGVVGAVWTAPKVQGLSLRPNYASASSTVVSASWDAAGAGSAATDFILNHNLPANTAGGPIVVNGGIVRARPTANFTNGRAIVKVQGSGLAAAECAVNITSIGGILVGPELARTVGASDMRTAYNFPGFTDSIPQTAAGTFVCTCA